MFKKMLKKESYDPVSEIRSIVKAMISEFNSRNSIQDYATRRRQLNLHVIQAVAGCTLKINKKGETVAKIRKAPSTVVLSEVQESLRLLASVESRLVGNNGADTDFEIPRPSILTVAKEEKKVSKIIKDLCGPGGIANTNITADDILEIAAVGDLIRKKVGRKRLIILSGVVLAGAVGVGTYILINNKKKTDKESNEANSNDSSTDSEIDGDIDDVLDDGALVDLVDESDGLVDLVDESDAMTSLVG